MDIKIDNNNTTLVESRDKRTIVKTSSLAVGYESGSVVLENVDLAIEEGTITTIVGPNGSGKSTLLKTIARQLKPKAGSIDFEGNDIWTITARDFAKKCSYVAQFFDSAINLTVKEFIALGRNPHQNWWSWNVSEDDLAAIDSAMERSSVTSIQHRYVSTLSGGEKQRTLIASALAQDAKVILLDEPISNLDFKHQLSVIALLKNLKKMNLALIVVLHDLNVIDNISDKVVLIGSNENGPNTIKYQGTTEDTLTREKIKEIFDVEVEILSASKGERRYFRMYDQYPSTVD